MSGTAVGVWIVVLAVMVAQPSLSWSYVMAATGSSYAWANRPVIIFSPAADDPNLLRQSDLPDASADELRQRDIVLIKVTSENVRAKHGPAPAATTAEMRRRLAVSASDFVVLLVGKDTGVKLRSSEVVDPQALFSLIDAMPMRRRKMRQSGGQT